LCLKPAKHGINTDRFPITFIKLTHTKRRRAKEKRERLRSAHLAPDYIPLGGAAALTSNQDAATR